MDIDIILITYNQEKYVSQAVESILMQKTNCNVHVIIADDCSTDSTLDIIHSYDGNSQFQFEYLSSCKQNIGMSRNYGRAFSKCNGKYVFILEGDDYWCNPKHLEQHIEFLENHQEASMSMNRLILLYEEKSLYSYPTIQNVEFYNIKQQIVDINHLGNLSGCCFRILLIKQLPEKIFDIGFADWLLGMFMAQYGLLAVLPEATSVYRINKNGQWSGMTDEQKHNTLLNACHKYDNFFDEKYKDYFEELYNRLNKPNKKLRKRDWIPPIFKYLYKLLVPANVRIFINRRLKK